MNTISNLSLRDFVSGQIVTVGKGMLETGVSSSVKRMMTGFRFHWITISFIDELHTQKDNPIATIHQSLFINESRKHHDDVCYFEIGPGWIGRSIGSRFSDLPFTPMTLALSKLTNAMNRCSSAKFSEELLHCHLMMSFYLHNAHAGPIYALQLRYRIHGSKISEHQSSMFHHHFMILFI